MPFTDPMADGPAIQAAGLRALKGGATLTSTLDTVRAFRSGDDATPIILMGYYNPIYVYGVWRFLEEAKAAGVDGLIVVDLPPEEDEELCVPAREAGLDFIRLATPTTDAGRLQAVLANTSGFLYYVSIAGITGTAVPSRDAVADAVGRLKSPHRSACSRRLRCEDGGHRRRDRRGGRGCGGRRVGHRRRATALARCGRAGDAGERRRRDGARPRPRCRPALRRGRSAEC